MVSCAYPNLILGDIEEWANQMVSCTHELCSTMEAIYEEKYGQEVLDLLEGKRNILSV